MMDTYSSPTNYSAILTHPYGQPYAFFNACYPVPGPAEAIVRLDFSGVCHGDVYSRDGGGPAPVNPIRPLVGGHEGVGEIMSVGEKAESLGVAVGDVVGIAWRSRVCEKCYPCRQQAQNHCEEQEVVGMHRDGTFQRQYKICYLDLGVQEFQSIAN